MALAITSVEDLDMIEAVIEHAPVVWASADARMLVLALAQSKAVDLLQRIEQSLVWRASGRWSTRHDPIAGEEYRLAVAQWRESERSSRVVRLARLMVGSPGHLATTLLFVRHLDARRGQNPDEVADISLLTRNELILQLQPGYAREVVGTLLSEPITRVAIIVAGHLALGSSRSSSRSFARTDSATVLEAYERWARSDDFFWTAPLGVDDDELIEIVSSLIVTQDEPVRVARRLLTNAAPKFQGWGTDFAGWLRHRWVTTHALLIVAVASLQRSIATTVRSSLCDLAWIELEIWLREAPDYHHRPDEHTELAIAYVWACAARALADHADRAKRALGRFDRLDHLIAAARNYADNLPTKVLDEECRRALRDAFEVHRPLFELDPHRSDKERDEVVVLMNRLAPHADL
jgi:hypothetical protein